MVGKTNLDQFATGLVGLRTPYPAPRNAVDSTLAPGGSSSGLRRGGRGRARELFTRHRHGGIRARTGGAEQHRRPEADARGAVGDRRGAGLPDAGHGIGVRRLRVRRAPRVQRGCRVRRRGCLRAAAWRAARSKPCRLRRASACRAMRRASSTAMREEAADFEAAVEGLVAMGAEVVPIDFSQLVRGRGSALRGALGSRTVRHGCRADDVGPGRAAPSYAQGHLGC